MKSGCTFIELDVYSTKCCRKTSAPLVSCEFLGEKCQANVADGSKTFEVLERIASQ